MFRSSIPLLAISLLCSCTTVERQSRTLDERADYWIPATLIGVGSPPSRIADSFSEETVDVWVFDYSDGTGKKSGGREVKITIEKPSNGFRRN